MLKYVVAALLVLLLTLGLHARGLSNRLDDANRAVDQMSLSIQSKDRAIQTLKEAYANDTDLLMKQCAKDAAVQEDLNKTLGELSKRPPAKVQEKVDHAPTKLSGGSVFELDPEYVRLLNAAYCNGNRDDSYCSTETSSGEVPKTN